MFNPDTKLLYYTFLFFVITELLKLFELFSLFKVTLSCHYFTMYFHWSNRFFYLTLCGLIFLIFPMEISADTSTIYTPVGKIGGRSYKDGAQKYIFSFYSIPYATFPSKFSNCTEFTSTEVTSQYRGANDYKEESSTRSKNLPIIINRYLPTFCMNHHFSRHFRKNQQKRKSEDYSTKDAIISDSCLSLDIFVQGRFLEFSAELAPVIVIFDDPKADFESYTLNKLPLVIHLTTYTDSLIVRVNYRNGPQGFLYLDDQHFPGNYGLIDQRQAGIWKK